MSQGKKAIRQNTIALLILFVLGSVILLGASFALGTTVNLFQNYSIYITIIAVTVSIIGLFKYKKWGFYLISIYFVYLLVLDLIYRSSYYQIIILAVLAYFI